MKLKLILYCLVFIWHSQGTANLVALEDRIFYRRGIRPHTLTAYSLKTESTLWKYSCEGDAGPPDIIKAESGRLFIICPVDWSPGNLISLDLETGKEVWKISEVGAWEENEGRLFVSNFKKKKLAAVEVKSGKDLWSISSELQPHAVWKDTLIVASYPDESGPGLVGLDKNTGLQEWTLPTDEFGKWIGSTIVTQDGKLLSARSSGPEGGLSALDLKTQKIQWHFRHFEPIRPLGIVSGIVVGVNTRSSFLDFTFGLSEGNGEVFWGSSGWNWISLPVGNNPLIGGGKSGVVASDVKTGTAIWTSAMESVNLEWDLPSSIVVSDKDNLISMDKKTGAILWKSKGDIQGWPRSRATFGNSLYLHIYFTNEVSVYDATTGAIQKYSVP